MRKDKKVCGDMPRVKTEVNRAVLFEAEILSGASAKGYSKADIPRLLKVSYPTYRRWVTNPDAMTMGEFKRVCKMFSIPTESIIKIMERKS